jgi:hypothetical protein
MKTLYFDIDGTILSIDRGEAKSYLRDGALERTVRRTGFTHLVCVGNIGIVASEVESLGVEYDAIGVVFKLCDSAFVDESWFRSVTRMIADPANRAHYIDYSSNWWYLDDLAASYLQKAGRLEELRELVCDRVFMPNPRGNGMGVIDWLKAIPV